MKNLLTFFAITFLLFSGCAKEEAEDLPSPVKTYEIMYVLECNHSNINSFNFTDSLGIMQHMYGVDSLFDTTIVMTSGSKVEANAQITRDNTSLVLKVLKDGVIWKVDYMDDRWGGYVEIKAILP